jgi:hypothetical protein
MIYLKYNLKQSWWQHCVNMSYLSFASFQLKCGQISKDSPLPGQFAFAKADAYSHTLLLKTGKEQKAFLIHWWEIGAIFVFIIIQTHGLFFFSELQCKLYLWMHKLIWTTQENATRTKIYCDIGSYACITFSLTLYNLVL